MKRHVMLDLETLGIKPGCPIVSIGAVCFLNAPEFKNKYFYCTITPESQVDLMDKPDLYTQLWWSKQSEEARAEVFDNPASVALPIVIQQFTWYLQQLKVNTEDEIVIWGNGASFDEPILAEVFNRITVPLPWSYKNSICFRTLKELGKMCGIEEPEFVGTKHNALADAIHQGNYAAEILSKISDWKS